MTLYKNVDGAVSECSAEEEAAIRAEWAENDARAIDLAKPKAATPAQAKIALFNAGLLDRAEIAAGAHPYKPVQIYWQFASVFERGNPYLQAIGAELELDDAAIDALFAEASRL